MIPTDSSANSAPSQLRVPTVPLPQANTPQKSLTTLRNTTHVAQARTRMYMTSLQPKNPQVSTLFNYMSSLPTFVSGGALGRVGALAPVERSSSGEWRLPLPKVQPQTLATTAAPKPKLPQPPQKTFEQNAEDFRVGLFS